MTKRPPLLVALLWAVGVAIVIAATNRWLGEVESNWIAVGVMSLLVFVIAYDNQNRQNAGLDRRFNSMFPGSPEKSALVAAVFFAGFMMLWGVTAREGLRRSAVMAAVMGILWYLLTREDAYLKRGVTRYPVRWLTVDRVFWLMALSLPLFVGIGAIVRPETFSRDDLMLTLSMSLPIIGLAAGSTWLRRKQRAKLLRDAQRPLA